MKLCWRFLRTDSQDEYEQDVDLVRKLAQGEKYHFEYEHILACYDSYHGISDQDPCFTNGSCALIFRGNRDELIGYVIMAQGGEDDHDHDAIRVLDCMVKLKYRERLANYLENHVQRELAKVVKEKEKGISH